MKWYAHENNVEIQTCESVEGEHPIYVPETDQTFKVDGFIPKEKSGWEKDVAVEFLGLMLNTNFYLIRKNCWWKIGCCWHGHDCLYEPNELCKNGKTAEWNNEWTEERCRLISAQGLEVRKFWECEVEGMLKENDEMRKFYSSLDDTSVVIKLRDAFTGGRVGPFSLKCDLDEVPGASDHFAIKFFDIVSLYPFTNFNCEVIVDYSYFLHC